MKPNHPEGRLIAIQQQMFLAGLLAEKMEIDSEIILRKLALTGLNLAIDTNEIALDAATLLPTINNLKTRLRAVPDVKDEE